MSVKLTKKQREMLDYIETFIGEAGYSPTYREIMRGLGYRSVATVAKHIDNLVVLGQLEKNEHEARSLSIRRDKSTIDEREKITVDYLVNKVNQLENRGRIREAVKLRDAIEVIQRDRLD